MREDLAKEWAEDLEEQLEKERGKLEDLITRKSASEYRIKIWNQLLADLQDQPPPLPPEKLKDCLQTITRQIEALGKQVETLEKEQQELKQKLANSTDFMLTGLLLQLVREDLPE